MDGAAAQAGFSEAMVPCQIILLLVPLPPIEHPCHRTAGIPFWRLLEARTPAFANRGGVACLRMAARLNRSELIGRYRVDRGKGRDQRVLGR